MTVGDFQKAFEESALEAAVVLQAAEGVASNVIDGVQTGVSVVQSILDKVLGKTDVISTPADHYWADNPGSDIVPIVPDIIGSGTSIVGPSLPWGNNVSDLTGFWYPKSDLSLFENAFTLESFTEPIPMCRCGDLHMHIQE